MKRSLLTAFVAAGMAALAVAPSPSQASAYPDKPISLVVPFPAGGATDAMARLLAERLGRQLGQPVIVDNRGGAGGGVAAEYALGQPRDGYTLFFATTGTMAINPHIYRRLKYDPQRDFTPIGTLASASNVLVVSPTVKAASVAELIALAKANPGKLTYGSSGIGSSSHLSGALFASMTGTNLLHVPYRGSSPALVDFLAGRVDMMFDTASTHAPNVRAGKVRALAVTSAGGSSAFPGVPTIAAAGVPSYDVTIWFGLVAGANVPRPVVDRLADAMRQVHAQPDLKPALAALGTEPLVKTPAEFAAFIRQENERWARTAKLAGATDLD